MSGLVGGVVACAYFGQRERQDNIVATDMGGTSFEVGLILKGQAHIANSTWIGRHEIGLPSVSVRTVGAGSGSIASVANGVLRVGRKAQAPCLAPLATAPAVDCLQSPTPISCSAISIPTISLADG